MEIKNKKLETQTQDKGLRTIYINNLGYLRGPSITDANISMEISQELAEKLSFWPAGKLWKYSEDLQDFELVDSFDPQEFRLLRQLECFSIINRGYLWYSNLTNEQQVELQTWYQAWLDVTETLQIPQKPEWLR